MPFHWGQGVHLLQGKQQRQARPPNGSTLAKTNERRADSLEVPLRFPSPEKGKRPLCPNVAMRDHRAVADARSSRERWEGIALSDPQRSRNPHTVAHDTIKLRDWTAWCSKEISFWAPKSGQPRTHLRLSPSQMFLAHSLQGKHQGRARRPTGRRAKSNGIGRRPKQQRSALRCSSSKREKAEQSDGEAA